MIKNFDAILHFPVSLNIIHDLDPILSDNKPEHIILCGQNYDNKLQNENLNSFFDNYGISRINAINGNRFVPWPQCTCTVYLQETPMKWYLKNEPATISLSIEGIKILIQNNKKYEPASCDSYDIIKTGKSIFIKQKSIKCKKNGNSDYHFSEEDGAVRVKIHKGKITYINQI